MAINYCTIAKQTIDSFCGSQRAKVLARLLDEKYTVVQPPAPPPIQGGTALNPGQNFTNPWYDPYTRDVEQMPQESPYLTVRVSDLFGDHGEETLYSTAQMEFVTVTNFEFASPATVSESDVAITVNIRDLEI